MRKKMPWQRSIHETDEEMKKRDREEHEEIDRRLALLEAQVKVLAERAGLETQRRGVRA